MTVSGNGFRLRQRAWPRPRPAGPEGVSAAPAPAEKTPATVAAAIAARAAAAPPPRIGHTVTVQCRAPWRRSGDAVMIGLSGEVVRVLPAERLGAPHRGERFRVEILTARDPFGMRRRQWLYDCEIGRGAP